jgi:hypothetical protein
MPSMKLMLSVAITLTCSGCVAVWGDSYNVAASNSNSVTIEYDPAIVSMTKLLLAAQNECDKYDRDAVLINSTSGNIGILVNTYRCESRTK